MSNTVHRSATAATFALIATAAFGPPAEARCNVIKREWRDGCLVTMVKCHGQGEPVGLRTYRTMCKGTINLDFARNPDFWRQRRK